MASNLNNVELQDRKTMTTTKLTNTGTELCCNLSKNYINVFLLAVKDCFINIMVSEQIAGFSRVFCVRLFTTVGFILACRTVRRSVTPLGLPHTAPITTLQPVHTGRGDCGTTRARGKDDTVAYSNHIKAVAAYELLQ